MEDLKTLIDQGKFIRVDAQGEHEEKFSEFCKQNVEDILKSLNRYPKQLIELYEKTQNKKFLNDIGLALSFGYFVDIHELLKSNYETLKKNYDKLSDDYEQDQQKIKNLDEAYEKLRQEFFKISAENKKLVVDNNDAHFNEKVFEASVSEKEKEIETLNKKLEKIELEKNNIQKKLDEAQSEIDDYKVAAEKYATEIQSLRISEGTLYQRISEYEKLIAAHEEAIRKLSLEKDSQICLDPEDISTMMKILKKYSIDETKFMQPEVDKERPSKVVKMGTNSKFDTTKNKLREGVDHNTCDTNPPLVLA